MLTTPGAKRIGDDADWMMHVDESTRALAAEFVEAALAALGRCRGGAWAPNEDGRPELKLSRSFGYAGIVRSGYIALLGNTLYLSVDGGVDPYDTPFTMSEEPSGLDRIHDPWGFADARLWHWRDRLARPLGGRQRQETLDTMDALLEAGHAAVRSTFRNWSRFSIRPRLNGNHRFNVYTGGAGAVTVFSARPGPHHQKLAKGWTDAVDGLCHVGPHLTYFLREAHPALPMIGVGSPPSRTMSYPGELDVVSAMRLIARCPQPLARLCDCRKAARD